MRIPPYWSKGTYTRLGRDGNEEHFSAYGWSFESLQAAREDARTRARRVAERIDNGTVPDEYEYLEHPLREEICQTLDDGEGGEYPIAVITRNRYGALVLNAAGACFVDVDFPPVRSKGLIDSIRLALSSQRRRERQLQGRREAEQRVKDWLERRHGQAYRLYRTAAGLRLLLIDRAYAPDSAEVAALLEELGSDPLYRRLTTRQVCFRARLTPKPWRVGCSRPPARYPYRVEDLPGQKAWQKAYDRASEPYGVCRLVDARGTAGHPSIQAVIDLHDRFALKANDAELA